MILRLRWFEVATDYHLSDGKVLAMSCYFLTVRVWGTNRFLSAGTEYENFRSILHSFIVHYSFRQTDRHLQDGKSVSDVLLFFDC